MVTFTSSSTVENFIESFKKENDQLSKWVSRVAVACIGEVTAKTAEKKGYSVDLIPPESTIEAFTQAIVHYFSSHPEKHKRS